MPYHYWGDDWFKKNGNDLYSGINYISRILRKYGKIKYDNKEKFGVLRENILQFWDGGLHYFFCKSYVRICHPILYWKIDPVIKVITKYTGINWLVVKYQKLIYNMTFQKACKKYPNVIDELISDIDCYELIKPGLFGKINGKEIHDKYWTTIH